MPVIIRKVLPTIIREGNIIVGGDGLEETEEIIVLKTNLDAISQIENFTGIATQVSPTVVAAP